VNLYNNEAPRIAANIVKLPELLKRSQSTRHRKFHSVIPGLGSGKVRGASNIAGLSDTE